MIPRLSILIIAAGVLFALPAAAYGSTEKPEAVVVAVPPDAQATIAFASTGCVRERHCRKPFYNDVLPDPPRELNKTPFRAPCACALLKFPRRPPCAPRCPNRSRRWIFTNPKLCAEPHDNSLVKQGNRERGARVSVKRLRRRAEICLRFAAAATDPLVSNQLRLMAAEYLAEAEHDAGTGAPVIAETPASPGIELPGPTAEEPKK